ncbi:MAG: AMP-binding protein, partial [Candidatus Helarchaeota archaeon]
NLHLKKGSHFAVLLYNCPEYIEVYFAGYKSGTAAFGINYRYREAEIIYIINQSKAKLMFFSDDFVDIINNCYKDFKTVEKFIIISDKKDELKEKFPELISKSLFYEDVIANSPSTEPVLDEPIEDKDKAFLVYTGGTTGKPKGAVWIHGALEKLYRGGGLSGFLELFKVMFDRLHDMSNKMKKKTLKQLLPAPLSWMRIFPISKKFGKWLISKVTTKDKTKTETKQGWISRKVQSKIKALFHAPMFHFKGWLISNMPLLSGSTVVISSSRTFNPREIIRTLASEGCNIFCTIGDKPVRDILDVLKNEKEKFDLEKIERNLLFILSGASRFSAKNKEYWWKYFPNTGIIDTVGASEAVIIPKLYIPGDKLESDLFTYQPDKMRIVDLLDPTKDVSPGEQGEGLYNMENLPTMKGYFNDKEKTKHLMVGDKWMRSGDLYELQEDGENVRLIGRIKETIVTGGEKIHPPEVEDVLKSHPSVYDAIVIGVPDPRWGQSALGLIILKDKTEASSILANKLIEFCKENLASYKKPKFIEFLNKFPITPAGKIQRGKLRDEYKDYVKKLGIQ